MITTNILANLLWLIYLVFSARAASPEREEIIYAECNLAEARLRKRKTRLNHVVLDRRTDVYDVLLGYDDVPLSW